MLAPELLLETLEDLREDDFKIFKWHLTLKVSDNYKPIPIARIEDARRHEAVSKIIESYGEDLAVQVTEDILKKMQQINAANKLRAAYTERTRTASSTISSTANPPVAASVSAQQGSVIIAPTFNSSSAGSLNITVNKS